MGLGDSWEPRDKCLELGEGCGPGLSGKGWGPGCKAGHGGEGRVLGIVGSLGYGRGRVREWLGPVCSGKGLWPWGLVMIWALESGK